ncbi:MAG: hypothetical protein H6819_03555 [Phycisphaerales bacterium]|nr:hypothetical protein [Phycisphaerales bacterium]MCB9856273.1 hypothetical protein [Phycisphaerales bacterium]MCB9863288.1 hypothetical protein [Phycisphaerales bacterium]
MTTQRLPILENSRIASPCNVAWASMQGDDRSRYCGECNTRVYNLVGMSDDEVAQLFEAHGHDLCIRVYQRHDGTLMTQDCPMGLHAARKRMRRAVSALGAAASFLLAAGVIRGQAFSRSGGLLTMRPFAQIANWLSPMPVLRAAPTMGRRSYAPPAPTGSTRKPLNCGNTTTNSGGAS